MVVWRMIASSILLLLTLLGSRSAANSNLQPFVSVRLQTKHLAAPGSIYIELDTNEEYKESSSANNGRVPLYQLCLALNGTVVGCVPSDTRAVSLEVVRSGTSWLTVHLSRVDAEETAKQILTTGHPIALHIGPPSSARSYHSGNNDNETSERLELSAILPLTFSDVERATILLRSITATGFLGRLTQLFIIVPDSQLLAIRQSLSAYLGPANNANIELVAEGSLFPGGAVPQIAKDANVSSSWRGYLLQMLIKLLASTLVDTAFYLTLDADIIYTGEGARMGKDTLLGQLLVRETCGGERHGAHLDSHDSDGETDAKYASNDGHNFKCVKGIYWDEPRNVHPNWWRASETVLQLQHRHQDTIKSCDGGNSGFGVTPAILSIPGARLTIGLLKSLYGEETYVDTLVGRFAAIPAETWSEYTLYRLTLDHYHLTCKLHSSRQGGLMGASIGYSVWDRESLPWRAGDAFEDKSCSFSVVQSSTGVSPLEVRAQLEQELRKVGEDEEVWTIYPRVWTERL